MHQRSDFFPLCWALKESWRNGYHLKDLKGDLSAALVVSLVSVPLSMALAIAIGLPPQHGIYTAIIGGIAASFFGGSRFQISGPTAAFVTVLIPIVAEFGLRGLIWCQILAGLILILLACARLGRLIHYMPYPVTVGFTTGIAILLAMISLKDFLGLASLGSADHFVDKIIILSQQITAVNGTALFVGTITLLLMIWSKKTIRFIPAPIIGVIGGTLIGIGLMQWDANLPLIGTVFSYTDLNGLLHGGLPSTMPHLALPTFAPDHLLTLPTNGELNAFLKPALLIAALAGLESLLSANIADHITGTRHHANAELHGIGIANILSAFGGGIPATAAIARTATNIQNGARSPIAGISCGILIMIYILVLSPLISLIPMSVLAALLLMTAYRMSHLDGFMHILRQAPTSDKAILLTCFVFTVLFDMVTGVTLGILLAGLLPRLKWQDNNASRKQQHRQP